MKKFLLIMILITLNLFALAENSEVEQKIIERNLEIREDVFYKKGELTSFTGIGSFIRADETRYEVEIKNGLMEGKGFIFWKNGDKYEGDWVNNNITGEGILTYANGEKVKLINGQKVVPIIGKKPSKLHPSFQLRSIVPDISPFWPAIGIDWYSNYKDGFGLGGSISVPFASANAGVLPYSLRVFYYKTVSKNIAIGLGYESNLAYANIKKTNIFPEGTEPVGNSLPQNTEQGEEESSGIKYISNAPYLGIIIWDKIIITGDINKYWTVGFRME